MYTAGRWARARLERFAAATGPRARVCLAGEPGVGKLHLALGLHQAWHPAPESSVCEVVRCRGVPGDVLYARLFGREGRAVDRGGGLYWPGAFERARGGTVVVAGLDGAPDPVIAAVGRVMAAGEVEPAGGDARRVGPSAVVATARSRERLGEVLPHFDADVELLPLRGRPGDIEDLFWFYCRQMGFAGFPARAAEHAASLEWPGNVAELRAYVRREIARWTARAGAPAAGRADVEARTRLEWRPPGAASGPRARGGPGTEAGRGGRPARARTRRPRRITKREQILALSEMVASGVLPMAEVARRTGATVSYTQRVLRKAIGDAAGA